MRRIVALLIGTMFLFLDGNRELRAQDIPPPLPAEELEAQGAVPLGANQERAVVEFEILTRGPIHEAFAEVYQANPVPGILVANAAPKTVTETPPAVKLDGKEVVWIPGYWAWDDDNQGFIWISGIWRKPPPGLEWVPGYWAELSGGFRWVSGFWARAEEKISIRPQPPMAKAEQEKREAAPENQFWAPGSWQWRKGPFVWRGGYYAPYQASWVWVPDRWKWTPPGYVHLAGYWDHRPTARAMLFSPVRFHANVLSLPNVTFTPQAVVDPWLALHHLWIRPGYGHYYFGDFYADKYSKLGFEPLASISSDVETWDPIYCYYQCFYRAQEIDFSERLAASSAYFKANVGMRPPISWDAQRKQIAEKRDDGAAPSSMIVSSLKDYVASSPSRIPLVAIDDRARDALGKADALAAKQILAYREQAEKVKNEVVEKEKGGSDLGMWSIPKVNRQREVHGVRLTAGKADSTIRGGVEKGAALSKEKEGVSTTRVEPDSELSKSRPSGGVEPQNSQASEVAAKKAALKADMDILRARFGNDPVRFQQEVDRLMSRRAGEPPATSLRNRSTAPDPGSGNSLQGSGRSGGLGSPDFRLLPRSGGAGLPPK